MSTCGAPRKRFFWQGFGGGSGEPAAESHYTVVLRWPTEPAQEVRWRTPPPLPPPQQPEKDLLQRLREAGL